ncbi:MAG TPA: hypothetical protein ENH29_07825 [Bacteroidetes bacterium]|nr:hypothetical protein [Bacteroidota bacterium]
MKLIVKFLLIIFLFQPAPGTAQQHKYDIYGYVKYMFSTTKMPAVTQRLNDHLLHARINTRWYPTPNLTGAVEFRLRGFYGGSVKYMPGFSEWIKDNYEYSNLDAQLWKSGSSLGYAQIDRLNLDYTAGNLQITAGRQRIAWGTALVWNVTDLFNPKSILDFDYEEKPGSDALRAQFYTGAVAKIEAGFKPGKRRYTRTVAGLWSFNKAGYDFFVIAGVKNNRKVLGGAWAGDIAGAGFRGEFIFSEAPEKSKTAAFPLPAMFGGSLTAGTKSTTHFVLSGDYTFSNSFYIHSELLFNSNGKKKNAGLFYYQAQQIGMLSPARWSLFQEFTYDITPLVRGSVFGIFNPNDRSIVVLPSVTWSAATNLDMLLIGFLTAGDRFTEFGEFGNSLFIRFKYSF